MSNEEGGIGKAGIRASERESMAAKSVLIDTRWLSPQLAMSK